MEKYLVSVKVLAFPHSCGKIYKNYFYICVFVKNRSCENFQFAVNLSQWQRQKQTEKPLNKNKSTLK